MTYTYLNDIVLNLIKKNCNTNFDNILKIRLKVNRCGLGQFRQYTNYIKKRPKLSK